MKILYTFTLLCSVCSTCFSQAYIPLLDSVSNTWYYSTNMVGVRLASLTPDCSYPLATFQASFIHTTVSDTLVNGLDYRAIGEQDYGISFLDCIVGYLREDTASRKVYFMDNQFGPEELIYDFSMQPGDSIDLNFASNWQYQNGFYFLDSIRTINLISGTHRIFFLTNPANQPDAKLQWIEGVGNPGNLIYNKADNFGGIFFNYCCWPPDLIFRFASDLMTCSYQGSQKVYFDSCAHSYALQGQGSYANYIDSCIYWNMIGSVEEIGGLIAIQVSPNPAGESTMLQVRTQYPIEGDIVIYDILNRHIGKPMHKQLSTGANSIDLNTGHLVSGIYLIEFRSEGTSAFTRMVVEK